MKSVRKLCKFVKCEFKLVRDTSLYDSVTNFSSTYGSTMGVKFLSPRLKLWHSKVLDFLLKIKTEVWIYSKNITLMLDETLEKILAYSVKCSDLKEIPLHCIDEKKHWWMKFLLKYFPMGNYLVLFGISVIQGEIWQFEGCLVVFFLLTKQGIGKFSIVFLVHWNIAKKQFFCRW